MPAFEYTVDADSGGYVQIANLPAKSEGRDIMACLVKSHAVEMVTFAGASAANINRLALDYTVPARWGEYVGRSLLGTPSVAIPATVTDGLLDHQEFHVSTNAASQMIWASYHRWTKLPALVAADTLRLNHSVVGTGVIAFVGRVEWEMVPVNEFQWQRLLENQFGRG